MNNSQIISSKNLSNKLLQLIVIILSTIALPFIVHLLPPINNVPIGAVLLPMFYISIPTLYLIKNVRVVAFGVGFAPIMNHFITGNPAFELMMVLAFELTLYTFILNLILKTKSWHLVILSGGLAYLGTKVISASTLFLPFKIVNSSFQQFLFGSISNGLVGIIILCIISYVCHLKFSNDEAS